MATGDKDPIEELNEWQQHAYNPGYWLKRGPPFFPPKPSRGMWILSWINAVVVFLFVIAFLFKVFVEKGGIEDVAMLVVGAVFMVISIRTIRVMKPAAEELTQEEIEARNRRNKKESKQKNQPQRRKDYR